MMTKAPERRSPLFLVTGLIIGLFLGLALNIVFPAKRVNLSPSSLADNYKTQYRLLTALAYASSGNIGRAQARLDLLHDPDPIRLLASQAQVALTDSSTQREARALASLASDLQTFIDSAQSTSQAVNTPNPEQQGAVATPFQTTAENAVYHVKSQQLLCESSETPPLLKIFVFDAEDQAQAGVRLSVASVNGSEDFFTGARPDMGPGYAEYELTPGEQYSLSIQGAQMVGGLQAAACETEAGEPAWGSWLLQFAAGE